MPDLPPVKELFKDLNILLEGLRIVQSIKKPIQINFTDPDSSWVIDLASGKASEGTVKATEFSLTFSEQDFRDLASGKANPMQSFMSGKIKFKGNMGVLMKMQGLQPKLEKLRSKY